MAKAGESSEPERLYANKYRTPEDLEKGYGESVRGYQKLKGKQEQLESEIEGLKNALHNTQRGPDPFAAALEETGIPLQAMETYIQNSVNSAVHGVLGEALKPFAASQKALSDAQELYPDFDLEAARKAVNQDPVLAETYNDLLVKDPKAAYVLAYNIGKHRGATSNEPAARELPPTGRADAGVAKNRKSAGEQEYEGMTEENYRKLLAHAQDTGDFTPFLRDRFKDTLGHLSTDPYDWQR